LDICDLDVFIFLAATTLFNQIIRLVLSNDFLNFIWAYSECNIRCDFSSTFLSGENKLPERVIFEGLQKPLV